MINDISIWRSQISEEIQSIFELGSESGAAKFGDYNKRRAPCTGWELQMKNKLYYVLFLLYAVVVAFILYINGVFDDTQTSMVNLLINVDVFMSGVM